MNSQELFSAVERFCSDMSRSADDTLETLEALYEDLEMRIEALRNDIENA